MARSRLIAWMDGELEDAESDATAKHARACPECREKLRLIRALSRDIKQYGVAMSREPQGRKRWIPASVAAAIALAAGLVWMRERPAPATVVETPATPPTAVARTSEPPRDLRVSARRPRRRAPARKFIAAARGEPGLPVIIPLDEVLPMGAAPPGAVLVGNLTFDAGGQLSTIRLQ